MYRNGGMPSLEQSRETKVKFLVHENDDVTTDVVLVNLLRLYVINVYTRREDI